MRLDQLRIDEFPDLKDVTVFTADGEKIGKVWEIVLNEANREPELISIYTGLFGKKRLFVPIQGARLYEGSVDLAYTRDEVENSPEVDPSLDESDADEIFRYYAGLDFEESVETTLLEQVATASVGPEDDIAIESQHDVGGNSQPEREVGTAIGLVGGEERVMSSRVLGNTEALLGQATDDGTLVKRTLEEGEIERISVEGEDSGEIEILPDGSVSIPLLEEQVVMTKRVLVRERMIVRKRTVVQDSVDDDAADAGDEAVE
jgi:PRC-barrel domain/Domain of unknown function (DUF2382)